MTKRKTNGKTKMNGVHADPASLAPALPERATPRRASAKSSTSASAKARPVEPAAKKPASLKSVCVYCGSGKGKNPAYMAAARTLGKSLAKAGVELVYGGGSLGLMGEVATSPISPRLPPP